MNEKRYIITNFAYGYGPFIRTTELALAVNALREAAGKPRFGIIVPWVYGEKQKQIMLEEFSNHKDEILLDATLGAILKRVFYADLNYEDALKAFTEQYDIVSGDALAHLHEVLEIETLGGEKCGVMGDAIALELAHAPRISYKRAPVYGATFGHISEILKAVLDVPESIVSASRELVARAIPTAESLDRGQKRIGLAEPGTFSYLSDRTPLPNELRIPPTLRAPRKDLADMSKGIYVTITGIPGLERLYEEARALGLTVYSNDPERLPGSIKASPNVLGNQAIGLHFARSGWGSVWASQLLGKAIVVPDFDPADDPEIYFNNLCVEKLGLGVVYRGQPLAELLAATKALEPGIRALNEKVLAEFGTLDGNEYMARKIVEDLG